MTQQINTFDYLPGSATAIVRWPVCVFMQLPLSDPLVRRLYSLLIGDAQIESILDELASRGFSRMPEFGIMASPNRLVLRGNVTAVIGVGERVMAHGVLTDITVGAGEGMVLMNSMSDGPVNDDILPIRDGIVLADWIGVNATPGGPADGASQLGREQLLITRPVRKGAIGDAPESATPTTWIRPPK